MCGIWGVVLRDKSNKAEREGEGEAADRTNAFWKLKHRGPDYSCYETFGQTVVGFHRLAVMDTSFRSNQPYVLQTRTRTIVFVCNGEIYNYDELIKEHDLDIDGHSDCLTIPKLYLKYPYETFTDLFQRRVRGEFAFALFEYDSLKTLRQVVLGRDQVGVRPLYYHVSDPEREASAPASAPAPAPASAPLRHNVLLAFASEVKALDASLQSVSEFPPGCLARVRMEPLTDRTDVDMTFFRWIYNTKALPGIEEEMHLARIREAAISSVRTRLNADRPLAFLLSGGVDSSLVCAIASKILKTPIKTFCCGMDESTDRVYARRVAGHIGSAHTEVTFTPQEALDLLDDVVRTTETWDTTTIRASTGQYIVCRHIAQNTDCKVVLVGEGPDEVCSSYLFNWYCPSAVDLHECALEYVHNIHFYDVKRADRCISRWGMEGRVPFLDPLFIEAYWNVPADWRHPKYKGIEKWWLRKAFDGYDLLPDDVLWRKKEAFSDGISGAQKSWYHMIQEACETLVTDEQLAHARDHFAVNCPTTKEAYYFRTLFEKHYPGRSDIVPRYWLPKYDAAGHTITAYVDPSARTLQVYDSKPYATAPTASRGYVST